MTDPYFTRRDIQLRRQERAQNFEKWRDVIPATVFSIGGSVEVVSNPEYVWIHEWGSSHSQARALKGGYQVADGMPVMIGKDPKEPYQWRIIGIYTGAMTPGETVDLYRYQVGNHHDNHQWQTEDNKGPDALPIWQPAFAPLKTEGNGSDLIISVWGCSYWYNDVPYIATGNQIDLTTSLPGAGNTRYVLVYLDKITGFINTVDGDEVAIGVTPPVPQLPSDAIASSLVQLTDGQTAVTTATNVTDARDIFDSGKSNLSSIVTDSDTWNVVVDSVTGDVVWE